MKIDRLDLANLGRDGKDKVIYFANYEYLPTMEPLTNFRKPKQQTISVTSNEGVSVLKDDGSIIAILCNKINELVDEVEELKKNGS